jgi:cytoskeletal protein CcmA (bactofilin family)
MASTYSPTLRIELIGNGEQAGTWGTTTNSNLGSIIEQAITGVQTITMGDATYTLTAFDGAVDEARNAVLVLGGTVTTPQNLIAPSVEKTYIIRNGTGANVTIKTSSGNGVTFVNGQVGIVYCNGTDFYSAVDVNNITGNVTVTGNISATGNVTATNNLVATGNVSANNATFTGTVTAGAFAGITGRIIQTVQSVFTGYISTNSSAYISTGHSLNITPSSASSKILLLNTFKLFQTDEYQTAQNALSTIYRNSTNLAGGSESFAQAASGYANSIYCTGAINYLDSPNTTSSITYANYIKVQGSQPTAVYTGPAMLIAMEIL